ncbi:lysophospholipid acyltransferase family protein [Nitratiruptor sp. YY09-18]|uniref:lysophospholipid acyltransferase family protein n=1 Tax=Nitratiruptor sp. YY09-18 TaxID=2724901 RepID=UPI0019162DFA|nr:lysophospholipid acyltransferase family protein [Nitratiruptor sp. YY09-18]BCD67620.1 Kdo2-lipid IVA lauroyltransferase/acyltransferase [Nitratiruptor sp. YY09-18]
MREKFEYWLAKSLIGLSKVLPKKALYALFIGLADILYLVDKNRRQLTQDNLLKAGYSKNLARKSYHEIAKTLAEILLLYTGRFDFSTIEGEFTPKIDKPKIFITAHFGNWEALAHYLARNGYPMVVVGREGNNKLIEKNITTHFRTKYGNRLVYKIGAMRKLIVALKNRENIGLLIDQKAGRDGIETTFFNRVCKTVPTVAMLAKKFDVEIVPIFLVRTSKGFKIIQKDFACKECDTKEFTQKLNDIFEEVVRMYPEQWFWMHNRWRV